MADVTDETCLEIGTFGKIDPGQRRGLPDHIDGIPVRPYVKVLTLPRFYSLMGEPLPMIELREDDDAGKVEARWPEPFPEHDLTGRGSDG
jgi:hypothetical protein